MTVNLVIDPRCANLHDVTSIPERGARIDAVLKGLTDSGTIRRVEQLIPTPCSEDDILRTHSFGYLGDFRRSCAEGRASIGYSRDINAIDPRTRAMLESRIGRGVDFQGVSLSEQQYGVMCIRDENFFDTPIASTTFEAALLSAGSVVSAIEATRRGGPTRSFCLTRPPGHHAEHDVAMGFCYINNIAVGADYLLAECGADRVAIVDFDVHHGNGTQHLFYEDPRVLVCNMHRDPALFYPKFCGFAHEVGGGAGEGFNVNVPLPAGSDISPYRVAFDRVLSRLAEFKPDWILVSAGFDAHKSDPLGGMRLNSKDYTEFARRLVEVADFHCGGRLVSVLEGGYNLGALSACVDAYLKGLLQA